MSHSITGSLEILSSILSNSLNNSSDGEQAIADLKADPKSFIYEHFGVSVDNANVVENTADQIHIPLPYYSAIDAMNAEVINENQMSDASGGEIFIFLPGIIAATIAAGIVINDTVRLSQGTLEGTVLPWEEMAKQQQEKQASK